MVDLIPELDQNGEVAVLSPDGKRLSRILLPGYPELTNLTFSAVTTTTLYAIDNSSEACKLITFETKESNIEKSDKDKASQI